MRLILPLLALVLAHLAPPAGAQTIRGLTLAQQRSLEQEARLIVDLLQNHHYTGKAFRDLDNTVLLGYYLSALDPQALFFTTEDASFIQRRFGRSLKTVYLFKGDLRPAEEIYAMFRTRVRSRLAWLDARLGRSFDFSSDRKCDLAWPKPAADEAEADRRWEELLADRVLAAIVSGHEPPAARAWVRQSFQTWAGGLVNRDFVGIREVFLDAVIRSFDPHSGYFSAQTARAFADEMDSAVSGIGLDVRLESGRCLVTSVHPGGPADLHSDLRHGDELAALRDKSGATMDLRGRSLEEIAGLIRGEAGTVVTLSYLRAPDATPREISFVRARVIDAAHRARGGISRVFAGGGERSVGFIVLPQFYSSGENEPRTSAAADVQEILREMLARGIDALVLDLRDNPGGALDEALALGGNFLKQGVGLHSRASGQAPETHDVRASPTTYDGPLVVLTSKGSASASEILAGMLQYHRRAVIVGAPATFGKGSVQAFVELDKMAGREAAMKWGMLRLTSHLYFLPGGTAVQLRGVAADLVLPAEPSDRPSESDIPGALPAERLEPATPVPPATEVVTRQLLEGLKGKLAADLGELPEWDLWRSELAATESAGPHRSLHQETRQEDWNRRLAAWTSLAKQRYQLEQDLAFPTDVIRLAAVSAQLAAHAAKQRSDPTEAKETIRLEPERLVIRSASGVKSVPLRALPFARFAPHAAELAETWSRAAGATVSTARVFVALQQLAALDPLDSVALLEVFAEPSVAEHETRARAVAVLARMVELDPDLTRDFAALDIPLREAQRIAAQWAADAGRAP